MGRWSCSYCLYGYGLVDLYNALGEYMKTEPNG